MMTHLKYFFSPPTYPDPKQDRNAKQLHLLLLLGVAITAIYTPLVYATTQDTVGPAASGIMLLITIGLVYSLKNGRFHFVSITILSTSYLAIMLSLAFNGGIRDQAIVMLVMLLTLAGLFLGERPVAYLGALSSLIVTAIYAAERNGLIVDSDYTALVEMDDLLISLIGVLITTVFLQQMLRQVGASEQQIREQAEALLVQNNALEQNRRSLQLQTEELQATMLHLESARKLAEQANRAKSDFLSSMSHELRTPLNGILGFTQVLARQQHFEPEETRKAVGVIQQSGEYLLQLITDILDLSKIEARKLELVSETINVPYFLNDIVSLMQIRAGEKQLHLRYQPDAALPPAVVVDEKRLRQVLLNLLGNGVKFTPAGSVTLIVSQLTSTAATSTLRFEVVDTGIGIEPAKMTQIFEPFEQAGEAADRVGGTGLGLSISQQLVELLGSQLQVESVLGLGSRFWFDLTLPLGSSLPAVGKRPFTSITGYAGPRRTVLVVDDIASNRAVLVALLEPLGFAVAEAANGETAVSLATAQPPDAIFMDLIMPGLSGEETIRQLQQQPKLANVPVFVMSADVIASANLTAAAQAKGDSLRVAAFLTKPLDADFILAQLQQQLGLVWEPEAAAAAETAVDEPIMVLPGAADLRQLHEMALKGDLTAVGAYTTQLSQNNPQLIPFAQKIHHFVQNFEEEQLINTLITYQQTIHES